MKATYEEIVKFLTNQLKRPPTEDEVLKEVNGVGYILLLEKIAAEKAKAS